MSTTTYELDHNDHYYSDNNKPHTRAQKEELFELLDEIADQLDVEWNACTDGTFIKLDPTELQKASKLLPDGIELHDVDEEIFDVEIPEEFEYDHEYVGDHSEFDDYCIRNDYN